MRRQILIATKTYPSISQKYRETVCTAGVLLDAGGHPEQWVRIYPIRYRYLDTDRRYKRWSIVEAEIERNPKDPRQESFRIEDDSIAVIRVVGTQNNWEERKSLVLPLSFGSIEEIKSAGASLGIVKPETIHQYFCDETEREWSPKQQAILDQEDMFEDSFPLDKIPYKFGYSFTEQDGKRRRCSISDWEISQLYRNCVYGSALMSQADREREALAKVRDKLEIDFLKNRDLHFIVGNLKTYPQTFMIIGLFYPPRVASEQLKLI